MQALMLFCMLASSFAALTSLSVSMDKHYEALFAKEASPFIQRLLYWAGWAALVPSLWLAILLWDAAIGTVIWLGTLTLLLSLLALLLAYQQRLLLWLWYLATPATVLGLLLCGIG